MSLLNPGLFLAGILAVSIPIIIHLLFRQRRRPVPWAAMRFLLEAYRKQKRRLKLEHLILLVVRCLILACLAGALGRPLLDALGALGPTGRDVYLLIDNGAAAGLRDAAGDTALDAHKSAARAMLEELGPGDRVGLITLGGPAESVVLPASSDFGAVRRLIEDLELTDAPTDLDGAFAALAAQLEADTSDDAAQRPAVAAVISELRTGSGDPNTPLPQTLAGIDRLSILAEAPTDRLAGNVKVVGLDPLRSVVLTGAGRATEDVSVRVRLERSGTSVSESGTTTVRVRATNGTAGGATDGGTRATVRWSPGQSEASITLSVTLDRASDSGNAASVLIAEIDRDRLESDNAFRRLVRVTDALEVGVAGTRRFSGGATIDKLAAADWLRLALTPTDTTPVRVTDLEPGGLDAATLATLDALALPQPDLVPAESWPLVRDFVDAGGMLLVTPPAETAVHLWTDDFTQAMGLGWDFAREASGDTDTVVRSIEAGPGAGALSGGAGVLALLADELEQLLRPVGVFRHLPVTVGGTAGGTTILALDDGSPWLVAVTPGARGSTPATATDETRAQDVDNSAMGGGLVLYIASAPTLFWTDLPATPLMVPLVQELVKQGVGTTSSRTTRVAGNRVALPPGADGLAPADLAGRTLRADVDSRGKPGALVRLAGIYRTLDQGGLQAELVAVNTPSEATDVGLNDPERVLAWLGGTFGPAGTVDSERVSFFDAEAPGAGLAAGRTGSPFALPLLIAALLLALVETGLARWFAHAWREEGPAGKGALA